MEREEANLSENTQRIEMLESQFNFLIRENSMLKAQLDKQQEIIIEMNKSLDRLWRHQKVLENSFEQMWESD